MSDDFNFFGDALEDDYNEPASPSIFCEDCRSVCSTLIPFGKCTNEHEICESCYDKASGMETRMGLGERYETALPSDLCGACRRKIKELGEERMKKERDNEIETLRIELNDILEHRSMKRYIQLILEKSNK